MNVDANCAIKNENIEVPFKRPKVEMDVKPKIERDFFKVKSEPIDDFNRGMEIIGSMNIPFKTEIQNENLEVPYKRPKIEMEIKNEKIEPKMEMDIKPKIEADCKAKIEQIDDINKGMEIVVNMNISIKAEIQNENLENYKCPVCNLVEFSAKNLLIQHMSTAHTGYIEYVFEKTHRSCRVCRSKAENVPSMSILDKILHIINCKPKIGSIGIINRGKVVSKILTTAPSSVIVVSANMDIPRKAEIHECFICKADKFPKKESLAKHLSNVHKKIILRRKKCFGKNIWGMTIPEKVSHLINSYENRRNKLQEEI
jgi:hypothetical protein